MEHVFDRIGNKKVAMLVVAKYQAAPSQV